MWFHKRERICRIIKELHLRDGRSILHSRYEQPSSTRSSWAHPLTFKVFLLRIGKLSVPIAQCEDETLAVRMNQFALLVKSCDLDANQLPYVPSGAGSDLILVLNLTSTACSQLRFAQRWPWLNRRQDHSGSALDQFETFGEQRRIASVELDVIRRSCSHLQSDGVPDDECDSFCLCLTNRFCSRGPALATVHEFVSDLME